jgi:hypothetical protein
MKPDVKTLRAIGHALCQKYRARCCFRVLAFDGLTVDLQIYRMDRQAAEVFTTLWRDPEGKIVSRNPYLVESPHVPAGLDDFQQFLYARGLARFMATILHDNGLARPSPHPQGWGASATHKAQALEVEGGCL